MTISLTSCFIRCPVDKSTAATNGASTLENATSINRRTTLNAVAIIARPTANNCTIEPR